MINLTSSNTDLAASTSRIVIPEGATSATFVVGTNSLYRRYSGLAFDTIITATNPLTALRRTRTDGLAPRVDGCPMATRLAESARFPASKHHRVLQGAPLFLTIYASRAGHSPVQ